MRAFVYPPDSYIGNNVSAALRDLGYDLLSLPSPPDENARNQFLQIADLVVLELNGNEEFAKSAAVCMSQAQFRGREQVLIGISDPQVWATCPLKPSDSYGEESTTLRVSDSDWANRSPCVACVACLDAETAIIRAARKGRLRSHVVCPGLTYGNGEGEAFHDLFRTCWEAKKESPPKVFGIGTNRLPLVHVGDLAKYVASVASWSPPPVASGTLTITSASALSTTGGAVATPSLQPYLLVADGGLATQLEVVQAVSTALGSGDISVMEDTIFETGIDRYTLDIAFSTTQLPGATVPFTPSYADGFLANIPKLIEEYKKNRNLMPLRIVLTGPPMSGKSVLASRLAKQYGLSHISAKEILAAAADADPELQKSVQAELSSKEPRVSPKNMAALMQTLLSSVQMRNRGYVLDAFPSLKTPAAAKFAFFKVAPMTPEEVALKEMEAADSKDPKAKGAPPPPAKGKDAKAKGPAGAEGPEVPPGYKLIPDPVFAPSHVIDLYSEDSELLSRLRLVEAAEAEAKAAAAASAGAPAKDAKGAKGKDSSIPTSHNNEKDFQRRKDALAKANVEAEEDLKARIATAESTRAAQQAKREDARKQKEAEANTLKARRKRAKEEATAAGLTSSLTSSLDATALTDTLKAEEAEGEVKAPEHGGTIGILVHDLGAAYVRLVNVTEPNLVMSALEAAAREAVGAPRNFDGLQIGSDELANSGKVDVILRNVDGELLEAGALRILPDSTEAAADYDTSRRRNKASVSMEKWLLSSVMPAVTQGLLAIAKERPADPIGQLVAFLREEASKNEAKYQSPYLDPIYEIQRAKQVGKFS